ERLKTFLVPDNRVDQAIDVEKLPSAKFGPNGSYCAIDKFGKSAVLGGGLSTEIEIAAAEPLDAIGSFKEENALSTVALGPDDPFVFIDASGHALWSTNLRDQSPEMEKYSKWLKWDTLQTCGWYHYQ